MVLVLELGPLIKAVAQLDKALEYAARAESGPDPDLFEQFRNSVIQTFEYSYELCFKLVRRKLMDMAVSADEIAALPFQDVVREAARMGLIDDPEAWFDYRTVRNKTSHAYQEEFAREAYAMAKVFLPDAKRIVERLRGG
jgi:nucleotidyltransferase substrate binding protein (TIGR01987 family)